MEFYHEERSGVTDINAGNIGIKIRELRELLRVCKNPVVAKTIQNDLTSYLAIKDLFDRDKD